MLTLRLTGTALLPVTLLLLTGCGRQGLRSGPGILGEDAVGLREPQRRLLFAQIVDDPTVPEECGILEGQPYKYFLKLCHAVEDEPSLREKRDATATYARLNGQPNLFRGHVVTRQGVVIEVGKAELPAEYNLPGYSVLLSIFVALARDKDGYDVYEVYEVRFLSPPNSGLYERLRRGIEGRRNPVLSVSGYFMKCHAKLTARAGEGSWRRPMLVAPEPAFLDLTRDAQGDIHNAKLDDLLPTAPLPGPKAEERLVLELLPGPQETTGERYGEQYPPRVVIGGQSTPVTSKAPIVRAVERLKERLPAGQGDAPSAVLLVARDTPADGVPQVLRTLEGAGVKRVFLKDESENLWEEQEPERNPRGRASATPGE